MIDLEGYIKITDFGLSKENIKDNSSAHSFCGTPEYLAPEILKRVGHGKAVDWWSLGSIIYEMTTGLPPFYTKDREKLFYNIKFSELKYPSYLSDVLKDLLKAFFSSLIFSLEIVYEGTGEKIGLWSQRCRRSDGAQMV